MKPKYFDIHSHLDFKDFNEDRDLIIDQMKRENLWTICVGVDKETSNSSVDLASKHENIFATVGVHPTDNPDDWDEQYFEDIINNSEKVVGIGECGLDYFRLKETDADIKLKQKELFIKHIKLAIKHNLPMMFHFRPKEGSMDAYLDGLDILEGYKGQVKGNSHFFVGNEDVAKRFLDLGHTVSFDGPITFSNDYEEVIKNIPIEKIMAETDSPFAAPAPYRGKRNNPLYVKEIYSKIAEIKNLDKEVCREILTQNAMDFWLN